MLDLEFFDVCSGALIPDVMHDVLEGALQHELKLLLKHLILDCHYFRVSVFTFIAYWSLVLCFMWGGCIEYSLSMATSKYEYSYSF